MAQATDDFNASPSQAEQILAEIRQLRQEVEQVSRDVEQVGQEVEQANQNTNAFNQKFDNYQKATQWVVQLAFSLIAAATVTVIVSTVLGK
jgi:uncharacterized protein (DUF3084 family)